MSLCAVCGMQLSGDATLCPHHQFAASSGWAVENRIMCDLLHRGVVPRRLRAADRFDDFVMAFQSVEYPPAGRRR